MEEKGIRARITEEMARIHAEIALRQSQLDLLASLLPVPATPAEPRDGHRLAGSLREGLKAQAGTWVSLESLLAEIEARTGNPPIRKSAQIQLNTWAKEGRIEKDPTRTGWYRWPAA